MPDPTPDPTTLRAALAAALAQVGIVADDNVDQYALDWTTTDTLIAELAQRGAALTPAAEAELEPGLPMTGGTRTTLVQSAPTSHTVPEPRPLTPRTEAGRALLDFMDETWRLPYVPENPTVQERVVAIETEAVKGLHEVIAMVHDFDQLGPADDQRFAEVEAALWALLATPAAEAKR